MNDYWNDPPDDPDLPPCPKCGSGETDIETTGDAALICRDCDHVWTPKPAQEPPLELFQDAPRGIANHCDRCGAALEQFAQSVHVCPYGFGCADTPPEPVTCPHGNPPGECNACDYLADEAFDAARERGTR